MDDDTYSETWVWTDPGDSEHVEIVSGADTTSPTCIIQAGLESIDISGWDTSNVSSMHSMFRISSFNRDIGDWNVSKVEFFTGMFDGSLMNQDLSS